MRKAVVVIALMVPFIAISGDKVPDIATIPQKVSFWSYLNPMNYRFKGSVTSTNPGDYVGGFTAQQAAETTKNVKDTIELVVDAKKTGEASFAAGAGFTGGLVSGPFIAARDGAVYIKDTAVEHPVIAGLALTAVVGGGLYHKFRPLTEEEIQKDQIEKDKRQALIRESASIAAADLHADDLRTCLNRHAYDHASTADDKIKRCHSPARKLASYNRKRADKMTSSFREYN